MMVYEGRPLSGRRMFLAQAAGPQLIVGGDAGAEGCDGASFFVS
jgi:hypothetical protein